MKKNIILAATVAATLSLTGCLETTYPSSGMNQEQIAESESSIEALCTALPSYMTAVGNDYGSIGYPGILLNQDVATGNLPIAKSEYDYYLWASNDTYLGPLWNTAYDMWQFYTRLVKRANLILQAVPEPEKASTADRGCVGTALVYRALAYFDMTRLYEYKLTGFADQDAKAESLGVMKLTVPLVTETTTEEESRNNPRQPFYVMYRFVMNDLNRAEQMLEGYTRPAANKANIGVAYGMKARLWLEMGTRFEKHPEDLAAQVEAEGSTTLASYDRLDITTAADCYRKAAEYARKAISVSGAPLSEAEWYDTTTGFNKVNHAWMFAVLVGSDDVSSSWQNVPGYLSPEDNSGVAGLDVDGNSASNLYYAQRMIDANLYSLIERGDWRKKTWIAPDDAGDAANAVKYKTLLTPTEWAMMPAYTSFKFRPGGGNRIDYHVSAAADYPLMRVEEMYLIEAEAIGHCQGVEAGKQALASYLNAYRFTDGTYSSNASTIKQFDNEILRQRRLEFWGEGISGFDFKRMEHGITLDYEGTNHPADYCFNFTDGYVAPRLNYCISTTLESDLNPAVVSNPDPSNVH